MSNNLWLPKSLLLDQNHHRHQWLNSRLFLGVLNVRAPKIQENSRKLKKIPILPYKIAKNRIFLNFRRTYIYYSKLFLKVNSVILHFDFDFVLVEPELEFILYFILFVGSNYL